MAQGFPVNCFVKGFSISGLVLTKKIDIDHERQPTCEILSKNKRRRNAGK